MLEGTLEPISNRQDYIEVFRFKEAPYPDVTAAVFHLSGCASITKTLDDGVVFDANAGTLTVTIPVSQIRSLRSGTYDVGLTYTAGGKVHQFFTGQIPVLDGNTP